MSDHYDIFLRLGECINPRATESILTITTTGCKELAVTGSSLGHLRRTLFVQNPTTHIVTIAMTSTLSTGVGFILSSGEQKEFLFDPGHYQSIFALYDLSSAVDCSLYCRETRAWYSTQNP